VTFASNGARSSEVVIRTQGLTKTFGQRAAVLNLNLEVRRGDVMGFLGPNGAGKTTTIRMMLGLIAPTSGSVEVLGRDIATHGSEVLPRVGALVETPALYPYMNGRDNLVAVADVMGGLPPDRIEAVLGQVGLAGRQRDRVRTYSLGMKQRLGVAMAMLDDPDVLVLDEPANGLDPAGIVEMRDLMRGLAANGKTVFISSHVLAEVQQICTQVAILNRGQLVTESSVEQLVQGNGAFVVWVENASQALALIQQQPWGKTARLDPSGAIVTAAPNDRGRELNQFLFSKGFVADSIGFQTESLEQVFLRLTNTAPTGGVQ
jgi:ABC-2 type transport system ATP-binding protein